jgi:hypothetical protein
MAAGLEARRDLKAEVFQAAAGMQPENTKRDGKHQSANTALGADRTQFGRDLQRAHQYRTNI